MPRSHNSEDEAVAAIIMLLQAVNYDGLECMETSWVRTVLLSPGSARGHLLLWVVAQLAPSEASRLTTAPPHTHAKRILKTLSHMGVCQPGDSEVIEGSALAADQLRFWHLCLTSVLTKHQFSSSSKFLHTECNAASQLLNHLTHSSSLQPTLKEEVSVIPGDLRERYEAWVRRGQQPSLPQLLAHTHAALHHQHQQYATIEEQWKTPQLASEERKQLQAEVCESVGCLAQQHHLLCGVHHSFIAPWTVRPTPFNLPNTGPLVHTAAMHLSTFSKTLETTREAQRLCETLEENGARRGDQQASTITSTLQALVNLTEAKQLPKDPLE